MTAENKKIAQSLIAKRRYLQMRIHDLKPLGREISRINDILHAIKHADGPVQCSSCGGTGTDRHCDAAGSMDDFDCERCHGTGVDPDIIERYKPAPKKPGVRFVSYDGAFPNLCSGTLTMDINGTIRKDFNLCSGGSCSLTADYDEEVEEGPWTVEVPDDLKKYESIITQLVNENVPYGCCGGCI